MTLRLFPALSGIIYPVKRTPQWATERHRSVSGRRTTLQWYSYPIYQYELAYSFLRSDTTNKEWQELIAFFNTVNGGATLFRYNDPVDNEVTDQTFGTGDGATTAFQLLRTITGTGNTWNDPVFHPTGTPVIKDAGVTVDPGDYTIGTTGIVTFDTAPVAGHTLTWTGTFDWLVRFSDDAATFEQFAYTFWELKKIAFDTEKL